MSLLSDLISGAREYPLCVSGRFHTQARTILRPSLFDPHIARGILPGAYPTNCIELVTKCLLLYSIFSLIIPHN